MAMFRFPPFVKFFFDKFIIVPHSNKHSGGINSIKFLRGEKKVITGSSDDTIRIFDFEGNELAFLDGHLAPINDIALHPKELYIASVSDDKTLRLWDLTTFNEDYCLLESTKQLSAVIFSKNGKIIITGGKDKKLRLYDFQTQSMIDEIDIGTIICLANHPTDEKVIVGSTSKIIIVDLKTKEKTEIKAHTLPIQKIDISSSSPAGKYFMISCSIDENVKLWDLEKFQELLNLKPHSGAVLAVKFQPGVGNKMFATGSYDRSVAIFQEANPKALKRFRGPKLSVKDLDWSTDGSEMSFVSADGSLRIYDMNKFTKILELEKNLEIISALFFDKKSDLLYLGYESGEIKIYSLINKEFQTTPAFHTAAINIITTLEISNSRSFLISAGNDKLIKIWDLENWTLLAQAAGHKSSVRSLVVVETDKYIISCSNDTTIRKYDITPLYKYFRSTEEESYNKKENKNNLENNLIDFPLELEELNVFNHHKHSVNTIILSNSGKYFATGSNDHTVALFDSDTFSNRLILKGHKDHVLSLMFSEDDKKLYAGGRNGDIIIFETLSGKVLNQLNFHNDAVRKMLPIQNGFFFTLCDDNSSLIFSNIDILIGQIFYSTNPKAVAIDRDGINFFVSTDIGEILKISPTFDMVSYRSLFSETNFDQLLFDIETELELFENERNRRFDRNEILYWSIFRQSWLDEHKSTFTDNKKLLSLYERLRKLSGEFSEEEISEMRGTVLKNREKK